jgi:hypothetical protein
MISKKPKWAKYKRGSGWAWSKKEDNFLRKWVGKRKDEKIAESLNRSISAIGDRAWRLGLSTYFADLHQIPGRRWVFINKKTGKEDSGILPKKRGVSNSFAQWMSANNIWESRKFRTERNLEYRKNHFDLIKKYQSSVPAEERTANRATSEVNEFLRFLKLSINSNLKSIIKNSKVSNDALKKLTRGNGYPDWKEEALEEKKPKDILQVTQWARAILEYRAGRKYRVSCRFTSTKRRIFKDVFSFYEWQLKQKEKVNAETVIR